MKIINVVDDSYGISGKDEMLGELAKEITRIIDKNSKVDWHDNTRVHDIIA